MVSHFRFRPAQLDGPRAEPGTLSIDRAAGLVHVRPARRRRRFTLRLEDVAALVVKRVVIAEVRLKGLEKAWRARRREA